jgi:hypothetical protein
MVSADIVKQELIYLKNVLTEFWEEILVRLAVYLILIFL